MSPIEFAITVIVVTASGALAPGPLLFATLIHGSESGAKTGLLFSVGHTIVEFSLIMMFAFGLFIISDNSFITDGIAFLGGIVLVGFGIFQIKKMSSFHQKEYTGTIKKPFHLFLIGLAFSGLNPYFLVWWFTVGAHLIFLALEFASFLGVIFMYICHVWMDYVWLISIAHFSKKGKNILGTRWYRYLIGIFGVFLIFFGFRFIISIF
jgi:threonine/homoserine/homoserine lactone efflux protein